MKLLASAQRMDVWSKYHAEHPDPELAATSDFGYAQRLLKEQLNSCIEEIKGKREEIARKIDAAGLYDAGISPKELADQIIALFIGEEK